MVLDGLHGTIPDFDLVVLLARISSLLKHNIFWRVLVLVKVQNMEVKFYMTTRQKIVLGRSKTSHAHDFLIAILIDGLGQHISPVEYHAIL